MVTVTSCPLNCDLAGSSIHSCSGTSVTVSGCTYYIIEWRILSLQTSTSPLHSHNSKISSKLQTNLQRAHTDQIRPNTMSQFKHHLEAWRNITGIGHGGAWGAPSSTLPSDGSVSIPSSPWSAKSVPDPVTPMKPANAAANGTPPSLNAKAPVFVPGGAFNHTGNP